MHSLVPLFQRQRLARDRYEKLFQTILPMLGRKFARIAFQQNVSVRQEQNAIANFLQTGEFFGLGLDYDARLPGLLSAVTLEEVNAAARSVLDVETATVVVAGPVEP